MRVGDGRAHAYSRRDRADRRTVVAGRKNSSQAAARIRPGPLQFLASREREDGVPNAAKAVVTSG
jgi:hypothetical protein